MAYDDLQDSFDAKYDSEPETGFKAAGIHVRIGRANYQIFRNGTVMITGNLPMKAEASILRLLWRQHLQSHVFR